jgi:hypothetical protein
LTALGQYPEAEPFLLTSYKALQAAPGAPPPRTQQALERIIKLYEARGKPDKAAEWGVKLQALRDAQKKTEKPKEK